MQATHPRLELGRTGSVFHFAHANGFPPGCYRRLLEPLSDRYRVVASGHRALDPGSVPADFRRWEDFADELLAVIDEVSPDAPVIGAGHSLGAAITLFAAARRPERFSALILLEPVFLPRKLLLLWRLMPRSRRERMPLVRSALRRQDRWPDAATVYASFRDKRVFAGVSDAVLRDCVDAMLVPDDDGGGVRLAFPKAWEAALFLTPPWPWRALRKLTVPTLGLRAETSNTLFPPAWRLWQRLQPDATFVELPDTTHLAPLEAPERVHRHIGAFLEALA